MKRLKMVLSLILVSSFFITTPIGFATTKSLSLEDAIKLSKENSSNIRGVLNQDFATQNKIRENIQNSYQLESALETYYDYIEIYNVVIDKDHESSGVHPWYKYIGKPTEYLNTQLGILQTKIGEAMMAGQDSKVKSLTKEAEFVGLYSYFGDNPSLTKESKYEKFKKNEAMLQNSVDLIETQYEQGLIAATRGTEAGVIKLYVGLKDLEQGLDIQKDLLAVHEESLRNMESSFNQGLISKVQFENQQLTIQMKRLETENMQLNYDNLSHQLKKMCEIPLDSTLSLTTNFENSDYKLNTPSSYYETAYSNNMDYINLSANLTYNEKNFEVMNKYLDDKDSNKDFTQPIYHQEKVDQKEKIDNLNKEITNKKLLIESNVAYAYNDLLLKKKQVEHNEDALKLSEAQLNSGIQSFKLGQITQLELDQLKLQYASSVMDSDQKTRAYNTGVENFKLLINYGIQY